MEHKLITIRIADRDYPLQVEEGKEGLLQAVAHELNLRIKARKDALPAHDMVNILAFVAFDCLADEMAKRKEQTEAIEQVHTLERMIHQVLKK